MIDIDEKFEKFFCNVKEGYKDKIVKEIVKIDI